jgi:hypothetical protein
MRLTYTRWFPAVRKISSDLYLNAPIDRTTVLIQCVGDESKLDRFQTLRYLQQDTT